MKQKKSFAVVDANCIIMHVLKALTAFSATQLSDIPMNCIFVDSLSSDFITTQLVLNGPVVELSIFSEFLKPCRHIYKVGVVREHDIYIDDKLSMVAGLKIYRIINWLAALGESKPMNWFHIPIPDYDKITVEEKPTKKRNVEVVKNTLITTTDTDEVKPVVEKKTKKTAVATNTLF